MFANKGGLGPLNFKETWKCVRKAQSASANSFSKASRLRPEHTRSRRAQPLTRAREQTALPAVDSDNVPTHRLQTFWENLIITTDSDFVKFRFYKLSRRLRGHGAPAEPRGRTQRGRVGRPGHPTGSPSTAAPHAASPLRLHAHLTAGCGGREGPLPSAAQSRASHT